VKSCARIRHVCACVDAGAARFQDFEKQEKQIKAMKASGKSTQQVKEAMKKKTREMGGAKARKAAAEGGSAPESKGGGGGAGEMVRARAGCEHCVVRVSSLRCCGAHVVLPLSRQALAMLCRSRTQKTKPKDYVVSFPLDNEDFVELAPPVLEVRASSASSSSSPTCRRAVCDRFHQIRDVWFRYGEKYPWLFKDMAFGVDTSTRAAIVGPNGVGKSTLISLLIGELEPTRTCDATVAGEEANVVLNAVCSCVPCACRVRVRVRVVSCRVVSCACTCACACACACRVVSCRVVSCRVVSCRVVSCRVVSCRVVSCRVVCLVLTGGEITRNRFLRIGKYSQHFVDVLPMDVSPVDYLTSNFSGKGYQDVRNLLGRFGLGGHAHTIPIKDLSGGQKARVVFTSLSLQNPHILFLDEPTNHLDVESVSGVLLSRGGSGV
jgi:ABC-type Mn2+/Zn2+ transport system ATPase subunit